MSEGFSLGVPKAIWNPVRDVWETESIDLFSEHSDVFSETWPTSGMTRNGWAYELPMPELPTVASAYSFLPTPKASDGMMGTPSTSGRPVERSTFLSTQAMLLAGHLEHRRKPLLPTPNTSSGTGPGEHGTGGPNLQTVLLPTPTTQDAANLGGPSQFERNSLPLNTLVHTLLPTPAANDSGNTPEQHLRKKPGREVVTSLMVLVDHGLIPTGGRMPPPSNDGNTSPDE